MQEQDSSVKFYCIARCLTELAIQNRALWKLVQKIVPSHQWPAPELHEAREEFKEIEGKINALISEPNTLPVLMEELRTFLVKLSDPSARQSETGLR